MWGEGGTGVHTAQEFSWLVRVWTMYGSWLWQQVEFSSRQTLVKSSLTRPARAWIYLDRSHGVCWLFLEAREMQDDKADRGPETRKQCSLAISSPSKTNKNFICIPWITRERSPRFFDRQWHPRVAMPLGEIHKKPGFGNRLLQRVVSEIHKAF